MHDSSFLAAQIVQEFYAVPPPRLTATVFQDELPIGGACVMRSDRTLIFRASPYRYILFEATQNGWRSTLDLNELDQGRWVAKDSAGVMRIRT